MTITITQIDTMLYKMTEEDGDRRQTYWVNTKEALCSCGALCCRHRRLLRYGADAAFAALAGGLRWGRRGERIG